MSSNINNSFTLGSEHDWVDMCIQVRTQQTCASDNYYQIKRNSIFDHVFFLHIIYFQCTSTRVYIYAHNPV